MTLFLARSTRLLPTLTYNSCPVPRQQRIPSQLPVTLQRVRDHRLFRRGANGGSEAESGDNADSARDPSSGTNSPVPKTPGVPAATANSDVLKGEEGAAQIAEAPWIARTEDRIEKAIFDFRFFTLMAITGSLVGSLLCFLKGCGFVYDSYRAYIAKHFYGVHSGKVILRLVEAVEIYLIGTVMLIFALGLFGLFISSESKGESTDRALKNTTLFGMFALTTRPPWMQITTLDTLKTMLGHCIVMILVVKLFEKSKTVYISSSLDLLMFSFAIFLASGALYLLQRMHSEEHSNA